MVGMGAAAPVLVGVAVVIRRVPVTVGVMMAVAASDGKDDEDSENPVGVTHCDLLRGAA